ncbi:MAG: hypothetical protein DRJ50_09350 [Actinobacteria bacterium]|nr:MAG: hypothetical protein DRJ50_09350 [Actinomycetota bacterium]
MIEFEIRAATGADERFLRAMQYQALFVEPGEDPFPEAIVDEPHIARYYTGFGGQLGDVGRVAVESSGDSAGEPIGAAWVRRSTRDNPSYGYIDDETPELGIAVTSDCRGAGVGSALLDDLLGVLPRCCLSVDSRNPAVRLYERSGFEVVRHDGMSLMMLRVREP